MIKLIIISRKSLEYYRINCYKSFSAYCSYWATAGEEDVSETSWNTIHAPEFRLKGSKTHLGIHIVYHLNENRDRFFHEYIVIFGIFKCLLGSGSQRQVFLRGSIRIGAIVKCLIISLRTILSIFCSSSWVHMER